jgi:mRNA interferase MazF
MVVSIERACRPALIVSVNALQSALGLAIVCAVTTHGGRADRARNDLEVAIPAGLPVKGVILPHQLRTIDFKARNATKLCGVPRATLQATRARLKHYCVSERRGFRCLSAISAPSRRWPPGPRLACGNSVT